jgi:transmembrane sensor
MQEHSSEELDQLSPALRAGIQIAFAAQSSSPEERWRRAEAIRNGAVVPASYSYRTGLGNIAARRRRWLGAAVVFAAAAVVALVVRDTKVSPVDAKGRTYTTRAGQLASISLDDGTSVVLAPRSTLTLSAEFGAATRRVSLTGEAYFSVRNPSASVPFIVQTGTITTRVLGTDFEVARYANDRATRVAVVQGRVVTGAARTVTLSAGHVAHVTDSTATLSPATDPHTYTSWTTGQLHFDEAPVPDVLTRLGAWYGIQFTLADSSLARQHVTAVFNGTSRAGMLAALGSLLDATPSLDSTTMTVTLRPHRGIVPPARPRDTRSENITHTEVGR